MRNKEAEASQKLGDIFGGMISENKFYARIISNFKRVADWNKDLTIGYRLFDGRIYLVYNPDYVCNIGHIELMDRMEHECIHILNDHPKRMMGMMGVNSTEALHERIKQDKSAFSRINKALDMTVNYELYIQKGKKKPIYGNNWLMANDVDFELNLTSEAYNELLKKMQDQEGNCKGPAIGKAGDDEDPNGQPSEGSGGWQTSPEGSPEDSPDGQGGGGQSQQDQTRDAQHNWFGNEKQSEDQTQASFDMVEQQLVSAIERAVSEQQRNRGTVPAQYQEMIDRLFRSKKVPWNKLLRRAVQGTFINQKEPCYYRPKRQYMYLEAMGEDICLFPSSKKLPGYTMVFAIDTSGSMGDDDLKRAATELLGLAEQYPGSRIYYDH